MNFPAQLRNKVITALACVTIPAAAAPQGQLGILTPDDVKVNETTP